MPERDIQTGNHTLGIDRLSKIKELRDNPDFTNKRIMESLGISRMTFYRDLSPLVTAGEVMTRKRFPSPESKPKPKPQQGSLERDKEVLSQLRTNPNLCNRELTANLFISRNTLHRSLVRLREAGEIIERPINRGINTKQQARIQSRDEKVADLRNNHPELTNYQILDELDEYVDIHTLSNSIKRLVNAKTIIQRKGRGSRPGKSEYPLEDIEDPEKFRQIVADLRNNGSKNQEIEDKTGRSSSTVSRVLALLVKDGKIKRKDNRGRPIG